MQLHHIWKIQSLVISQIMTTGDQQLKVIYMKPCKKEKSPMCTFEITFFEFFNERKHPLYA